MISLPISLSRWDKNSHFTQTFTYWKSQFLQNSHFLNLIFHKIHITIEKSNSTEFLDKKLGFAPVWGPFLDFFSNVIKSFMVKWKKSAHLQLKDSRYCVTSHPFSLFSNPSFALT